MEHQLEAWLKTYRGETLISPIQWSELPKECSIRLDHFARDEAVRRADEFARDGQLDLDRQDAIRQLVDAMAQCWMLPAEPIRRLVEDFLDQQPARPGFEFEKITTKLYRRRVNGTWKELLDMIDYKNEPKILSVVNEFLDVDRRKNTDRTQFLNAWREAYDSWTLAEPKDCVAELIETSSDGEAGGVALREILPLIKHRGGHSWAKAIELELEVGVEQASRDDLVRMLRRFALIVKRERSAQPAAERKPSSAESYFQLVDEVESEPEPTIDPVIEEPDASIEVKSEPEIETPSETEEAPFVDEPEPEEPEQEIETTEEQVEAEDVAEPEPDDTIEEVPDVEMERQYAKPTEEDLDAAEALFGEDEEQPESDVEVDATDETEEEPATELAEEKEEPAEKPDPIEEMAEEKGEAKRLKDVFTPSPVKDRVDRFANIRSGPLRDRAVQEMYNGDETLLDVFLAKLSGAPDWNRAKQFIANEFFRCKVDLHSELGQELFLQLKESLDV